MVLQLITFLNHLISLIGLFTLHNWCGYLKSFLKSKSRLTIPEFYGSYCNQFVFSQRNFSKGDLSSGDLPSGNFPSGNFSKVSLGLLSYGAAGCNEARALRLGLVRGQELRLGQTW